MLVCGSRATLHPYLLGPFCGANRRFTTELIETTEINTRILFSGVSVVRFSLACGAAALCGYPVVISFLSSARNLI
jgi:hypothetical protein